MTVFHDALSGKKRELNFKTKTTPAPYNRGAWCADSKWLSSHDFDEEGDLARCIRCGCTRVLAQVKENIRLKGKL